MPLFQAKVTSRWLPLKRTVKPLNVKYRSTAASRKKDPWKSNIWKSNIECQILENIALGGECMMTNCSGLKRSVEYWMMENRGKFQKKTLPRAKRQSHKPSSLLASFLIWVAAIIWHHQHQLQISWPASTVGITWKFATRWLIPSPLFTQLSFNLLFCPKFFCYIIVTYFSIFTYFLFLPFWFFSLYWTLQ